MPWTRICAEQHRDLPLAVLLREDCELERTMMLAFLEHMSPFLDAVTVGRRSPRDLYLMPDYEVKEHVITAIKIYHERHALAGPQFMDFVPCFPVLSRTSLQEGCSSASEHIKKIELAHGRHAQGSPDNASETGS